MFWKGLLFSTLAVWSWDSSLVFALTVADLNPEQKWQVKEIVISGDTAFAPSTLLAQLRTQARPWYLPWKERPSFDPVTFTTDLERLQRFYEAHGYYQSRVTYDLQVDDKNDLVTVQLQVEDHRPVFVSAVQVNISNDAPAHPEAALPQPLPLQRGEIFTEEAYQQTEQVLRDFFLKRGHAWIQVQRKAEVDLERAQVRVHYTVHPGPQTVFGETRVEGTKSVDPEIILRELTYQPGEQFSLQKISASRQNIVDLNLFSSVQVAPEQTEGTPRTVPMRIRVEEKPPRSVQVGVGYNTEDEFRGQISWQHRNWLGGGRLLSFSLKASSIRRALEATFVQPYFLSPYTQAVLNLKQGQEDEETYFLNFSRFTPRLEHDFSPSLSGFLGYRLEFLKFNKVNAATIRALGGIKRDGVLSGPSLGLVWDTTEDLLNPQEGVVLSLLADQAGEVWGGNYNFYRLTAEAKHYHRLDWEVVFASRLKLGLADSFGARDNVPLSERFYAGGDKGVRGYGRRRLGPLSAADDPLGGLSLIEGSLELRRPIWQALGGAVFLDFGQVALRPFDIPVDDLKFAPGLGASYTTPIGPLRLDIGFPIDPPRGDASWKVHFSVGQSF